MDQAPAIKLNARYYRMYPPGQPPGYIEEELLLNLDNTVFLNVDVYGLGFDENGQYGDVASMGHT